MLARWLLLHTSLPGLLPYCNLSRYGYAPILVELASQADRAGALAPLPVARRPHTLPERSVYMRYTSTGMIGLTV